MKSAAKQTVSTSQISQSDPKEIIFAIATVQKNVRDLLATTPVGPEEKTDWAGEEWESEYFDDSKQPAE